MRVANLWLAGSAGALALLGSAGLLNPVLLLAGVFLLGVGFAVNAPAWASVVLQVVTDKELPSASTLNGVQFNITSILGPAVARGPSDESLRAGCLRSERSRLPVGFYSDSFSWKNWFGREADFGKPPSFYTSFRHVRQAPNVGNILARNAIFSFFVVAIPALAPVLLLKELRLDASSLGLVFASMGVGSVISAIFVIPWQRSRLATDALMMIAQVTLAGVYILMAMVHHCLYCLVPMALADAGWTLAASELWVICSAFDSEFPAWAHQCAHDGPISRSDDARRSRLGIERGVDWYSGYSFSGCFSFSYYGP